MPEYQNKKISQWRARPTAFKYGYILYIVALLIYPYIFIIHHLFPNTYSFGVEKSLAVAAITLALLFAFLLQAKNIIAKLGQRDLIFFFFIFISLLAVRFLTYQEDITVLMKYRIFIFPIIYAGLACHYLAGQQGKKLAQKIIIGQTIIQALFGIFLWNFVYTGKINSAIFSLWEGGGRMGGTLMSSNLFPGFLLLGAFILISPYIKFRLSHSIKIILLLILTLAIIYSNSRWPSFVAVMLLLVAFMQAFKLIKNYSAKTMAIAIIATSLLASTWLLTGALQQTIGRAINEDPGVRLIKYELGLNNVLDNAFNGIFIGTTNEKMRSRVMVVLDEGLKFSDNSYILMMEMLGILVTFLYFFLFAFIIRKTCVIRGNSLLIFYFAISLFVNSAIAWDLWLFYLFATLYCLQPKQHYERRQITSTTHKVSQC